MKRKKESGVLTLEAAILMPIFIMLALALDGMFLFYMGQQIMVHTAAQTAKSMAFDPYAVARVQSDSGDGLADLFVDFFGMFGSGHSSTEDWSSEKSTKDIADVARERFTAYLRGDKASGNGLLDIIGVSGGIDGIDFSESKIEGEYLLLKIRYTQEFPFNLMDIASFSRLISLKVRLFTWK